MGRHIAVFGGTGMIGHGVVLECVDDSGVESVVAIGRRPLGIEHPKLDQIAHSDFTDFSALRERLSQLDACFYCLGVSAAGMSEADYRRITVDFTAALCGELVAANPAMTMCFVSGQGTSSTSAQMWARAKAEAERHVLQAGFARAFCFRPGMIIPRRGVTSTIRSYRVMYGLTRPLHGLFAKMPSFVTDTIQVGRAMLAALDDPREQAILENREIAELGSAYRIG